MTTITAPSKRRFHREKPVGEAGVDRPRLLSDLDSGERLGIIAALAVGGVILSHIVRYDWAAIYFNAVEPGGIVSYFYAGITNAWHGFLSVDWQRHLARFGVEGLYTSAVVQIIFYGIKRWPPKEAGWWTLYVKRFLLVPSDKLPEQTLWCLALAWLWIIVWAIPLGVLITLLLDVTNTGNQALVINLTHIPALARSDVSLANWQQPLIGFATGFIAARGVIKGTAFHAQRLIIKESLEAQDARNHELRPPVWMALFPYMKWRYQWIASLWLLRTRKGGSRVWKHQRAQRIFHVSLLALGVLFLLALTYQGWHILTYFDWSYSQPFLMR
jgi:hypothetical protein